MRRRETAVFLTLIVLLAVVNFSIYQKEQHLAHGRTVCLRLAPADPRSLMQGDYMRLRFALADALRKRLPETTRDANTDGYMVLKTDTNCTATFVDLDHGQPLAPDLIRLRYRLRNGRITIATNAFFFQEGTGKAYAKARYGVFRVDKNGAPLLTGLKDAHLRTLHPSRHRK